MNEAKDDYNRLVSVIKVKKYFSDDSLFIILNTIIIIICIVGLIIFGS